MRRTFAISGPVFAAGVLFLLVVVSALSIATRRPYLEARTGSWHISKVGRMTEAETHECGVSAAAQSAEENHAAAVPLPVTYFAPEELLPNALALLVHKHHFRSPPSLY